MNFRQKLAQFMYGRNGMDAFGRFLLLLAVVLMLLSTLFAKVALICCIWRTFSRDIVKRQQENAAYYEKSRAFRTWCRSLRDRWQQRRDYKFFRCPSCHALLRVPRGRGMLELTCRKCGNRFKRRS